MNKHTNEFNYAIPFWNPSRCYDEIRNEIIGAVDEVMMSGNMILGEEVEKFEQKLATRIGTKYVVGVNSGTDALFLSLKALGIGEGDEVITTPNTFFATISEIIHVGAKPILVDIGDDWLIDVEKVKEAITDKTKAIIPVHLSGDMADMKELLKLGIPIIEDSAQAFGSSRDGLKAGSSGVTGCFSFYPAKILGSAGDAGAIATNSDEIADYIRKARDHNGINRADPTQVKEIGYNSRLDSIQAAILNVKLNYIDRWLKKRQRLSEMYLTRLPSVIGLPINRRGRVWQDFVISAPQRNELARYLDENSIKVRGHDLVGNNQYLDLNKDLPKYNELHETFLRLPLSPETTEEEVEFVVDKINEFYA